ncbi:MAG: DUF1360 domain-containing protein [Acidimicrobiales bacterium]
MGAADTAIDLATDAVAAWRLTHLVTEDAFPPIARAREAVLERCGPDSAISYLVTCSFCVGIWAGAGIAVARALAPSAWRTAARALAVGSAAPIIENRLAR